MSQKKTYNMFQKAKNLHQKQGTFEEAQRDHLQRKKLLKIQKHLPRLKA